MTRPQHDPGKPRPEQSRTTSQEIHGTSRIQIFDGEHARFRQLAQECVDVVRARDTGTVEYRFYVNAAGTEAVVHERYRDSDAGLEHMANIAHAAEKLAEVCTMTGEVCGEPTAELRDALTTAGVTVYGPLAGSGPR